MADVTIFSPETLGKPLGQYSQITRATAAEFVFIAGQVGVAPEAGAVAADDFDAQCAQTFSNIAVALESCGADWKSVAQFTTYLVDPEDIPKFMSYRIREFPKLFPDEKYPPNTLLIVSRLVKPELLVEVQTIAVL